MLKGRCKKKEITCFSYDEDHQLRLDGSSLNYYYPPAEIFKLEFPQPGGPRRPEDFFRIPLSNGLHSFRQRDSSIDEHLDSLLVAIMDMEKKTEQKLQPRFVTWRGMMTNVSAAITLMLLPTTLHLLDKRRADVLFNQFLAAPYDWINDWAMNATYFDVGPPHLD